ncbi:MAG: CAP domain-containing protein [Paracoccaceae bacterium]
MIRSSIILFLALFTLSACGELPSSSYDGNGDSGSISTFSSNGLRLRHLDSINALRVERGLQPLQLSAQLNAAADTHARDMAAQQRAWDFGSDRSSPQARATRAGFKGVVRGENVAETFKGEFLVLQTWLNNTASRATILDAKSTHLGYGWYQETNGKLWWVQVVGQAIVVDPLVMAQSQ